MWRTALLGTSHKPISQQTADAVAPDPFLPAGRLGNGKILITVHISRHFLTLHKQKALCLCDSEPVALGSANPEAHLVMIT